MLFLSEAEKEEWRSCGQEILAGQKLPGENNGRIRSSLVPVFHYYAGTLLVAHGLEDIGMEWIREGITSEREGIFSNSFLSSFLERHGGRLVQPVGIFSDPAPFIHFTTVPFLKDAREIFIQNCGISLPRFSHPLRIMDIGCGDGALIVTLLQHLREIGSAGDIGEIMLVDSSPAMCACAREKCAKAFPEAPVRVIQSPIQEATRSIDSHYDVMLSSLAYHHMPREVKLEHLKALRPWTNHFILFEVDANNDTPGQFSPELALSVYQAYGRLIDSIFAHDAPIETAVLCVDNFIMLECISFFLHPRGKRTDYHMLHSQWHSLFNEALGREFTCWSDRICYADEYMNLISLHYGR